MSAEAHHSPKKSMQPDSLGYSSIEERMTPELIFAFVEPIGGGANTVINELTSILTTSRFKYNINHVKISEFIKTAMASAETKGARSGLSSLVDDRQIASFSEESKRIYRLQQYGNILRQKHGSNFLAKIAIQQISEYRAGPDANGIEQPEGGPPQAKPIRVAHIIRSLKNTEELALLKAVYGNMLILIATSGNYQENFKSFKNLSTDVTKDEFDALSTIDQDEGVEYGQQVRDVFYKADLFLNTSSAKPNLENFLQVLFGQKILSPTLSERMMFEAFSASVNSTCLSRQVGAAIADENGELLSIGWNDVPAFGGGLATTSNYSSELCCFKGFCNSNKEIKVLSSKIEEVIREIQRKTLDIMYGKLKKEFAELPELPQPLVSDAIDKSIEGYDLLKISKKTGISGLIEFSRAIHAEMEAILSAARLGKQGLKNGVIYVTTFPCENCVKHMLAAGLKEVVYIEPYPKSRATTFFPELVVDTHQLNNEDLESSRLKFSQFTGISPQAYLNLFKKNSSRKDKEGELSLNKDGKLPLTNVLLDGYYIYESYIATQVSREVQDEKK